MSELRSSTSDGSFELTAEAQRHRDLLRGPVEEYRRRIALQARYVPMQGQALLERAEERIADLMIDPSRHHDLDLEVYRAVRDGWPTRFDSRWQMFVATRGRREVLIPPQGPERRFGIIARMAANRVELEQILLVAMVVIAHPEGPGAAVDLPARANHAEGASAALPQASGSVG
ncbi:hypothetical protein KO481_35235 [Nocardia sp. NEAU-G5]|uniref:Uncharacterized protein n=1 Tax=Nocardia albiluteola TaxID=2842303 RepID=A0ABS6B913_9NOCA|nr:hypothetical protein [Nocardia albiluteola]MBU3066759.1 hypothetical protein [Nocardia albiluteola]